MKLSVIIPAYNAAGYLKEAVMSVKGQNGYDPKDCKITVIDDGSTDATCDLAKELADVVLTQDHKGAAAARNLGIQEACGDLILLLDADDRLEDGALDALYGPFSKDEGVCAVFGLAKEFYSPELTEDERASLILKDTPYEGTLPGCSLIKRSVFEETGYFQEDLHGGETVEWMMRFRSRGYKTANIDTVTLLRRIHANNTGRINRSGEMANYAKILREAMLRKKASHKKEETDV